MSLLSDEEIMVINQTAEFDSAIGYARKIESAILDKLKAQEPVAIADGTFNHNCELGVSLYTNPIPADDVVRQRDEMLAALEKLAEVYDAMGAPRGPSRIIADAAIASSKGSK